MAPLSDPIKRFQEALAEARSGPGGARKPERTLEQLPLAARRKRAREAAAQAKKKWRIPASVRQYLPYVAAFLVVLAPLLHNPPRDNEVPPYLVGIWRTDAPGYEDRYLQFAPRNVVFGTGGYEGESYIVAEVQISPVDTDPQGGAGGRSLFTFRYMKADKLEYNLSFYYEPKPAETITFKNQETLKWTRKGPDL